MWSISEDHLKGGIAESVFGLTVEILASAAHVSLTKEKSLSPLSPNPVLTKTLKLLLTMLGFELAMKTFEI